MVSQISRAVRPTAAAVVKTVSLVYPLLERLRVTGDADDNREQVEDGLEEYVSSKSVA